ncbi:LOW QUALITY PROTEIN: hypothetical protein RJ639_040821 [Escallonia herrerae]|uniref:Glucose-methanol-choline oxidoreductase N-terminal domain-containing protein n=1 Tax=Escallonia herrerae TaxID=1293975 RepID=A0AA89B2L8_9ASTE|nr:LOW QUALITY PROTEIN: hypothetical protein RJ639_040821 [Escallonia herrerae]
MVLVVSGGGSEVQTVVVASGGVQLTAGGGDVRWGASPQGTWLCVWQVPALGLTDGDVNVLAPVELAGNEEYDYIVVGAGTAGCPLAATLSSNHSVLLLERGGQPDAYPNVLPIERLLENVYEANDKDSPAQPFTTEDGMPSVRGRVLGGSSMINFGLYSRADEDFYAKSGIKWDMDVVKKAYEWSVVFGTDKLTTWETSFRDALLESNIGPDNGFTLDHVVGAKVTGSTFDETGRRHGAVELLNKANPGNLRVNVNATVESKPITFPDPSPPINLSVVSIITKVTRPQSSGSLQLASATNISINPVVRFNYFTNPGDLSQCSNAMPYVAKMITTPSMEAYKFQSLNGERSFHFVGTSLAENESRNGILESKCCKTLRTFYHQHGGWTVGKVVDGDLKAIGIKAL